MGKVSRRSVMRAFGDYVDFCSWLADAKHEIGVEDGDDSTAEIAQMVVGADQRYAEKLDEYLGRPKIKDKDIKK
jgi:hypothetical protein